MRFRIEPVRLTLADAVVDPASWALTVRKSGWRDSAGVFGPEDSFDGVSSKGRRGRGRRTRGESAIVCGRLLELTATVRESDAVGLELFRSSISFQYMTGQSRASLAKRIAQRPKKGGQKITERVWAERHVSAEIRTEIRGLGWILNINGYPPGKEKR